MKQILKVVFILTSLLAVISLGSRICAAEASYEYTVTESEGEYLLTVYNGKGESPLLRSGKISEIIQKIEATSTNGRIVFSDVSVGESLDMSGSYVISGSLTLKEGAVFSVTGNVTFSEANIEIVSGKIRIKEGSLLLRDSEVTSKEGEAVCLDYTSGARLVIEGGSVKSLTSPAIKNTLGTVVINGGAVTSGSESAIENSSTLILSGAPEISGREFDIVTSTQITLKNQGVEYTGEAKIKYSSMFSEGEIKCVFYSATEASLKGISLFDKNGNGQKLTYFDTFQGINEQKFGAVYLPYRVSFYSGKTLIETQEIVHGVALKAAAAPEKSGYRFLGYATSEGGTALYDFAENVNKSFNLYAKYELLPPSFELSSLEFIYDGLSHSFGIDNLSHPLLSSSILTYVWYKDDKYVSNVGPKISLTDVLESGGYRCEITLSFGQDTVKVTTPEAYVKISKKTVTVPDVHSKEYNGTRQLPDVFSTKEYSVLCEGGSEVGKYVVTFNVTDSENLVFHDGSATLNREFEITKGQNFWTDELSVFDVYEGLSIGALAVSRFGEARYLFSEKAEGPYTDTPPTLVGEYFVVAFVEGSDNYTELKSEAKAFSIIKEEILGLSVHATPTRTEYTAFDVFSPKGLSLLVTYSSGRTEVIGEEKIKINYQSAPNMRYGDTAVIATYLGKSIPISVSVKKAEYDLSSFLFSNLEVVYDSENKSIAPFGEIPTGLDGLPLKYSVFGGGKNVGTYQVVITFSTDSKNYNIPKTREATLTVLPKEVTVVFENTEFTYDGESKCPGAYYVDIHGRKVSLSVSGARSLAGEYTAVASGEDSNYRLVGGSTAYKINKADYDLSGVYWTSANYTYDGSEKAVYINGLPSGVSVIGYSDNRGTGAGKYTAKATLTYDENNFNPPKNPEYVWEIMKADYDLTSFQVLGTAPIFSGNINYPEIKGELPVGFDGVRLEYRFSGGAIHVGEGKTPVEVSFHTESKNYNTPGSITVYVEVKPLPISVLWEEADFTYNGGSQVPRASSEHTKITVLGSGKNAGEYIATAVPVSSDYSVQNREYKYVIKRAENLFFEEVSLEDIYEGREPKPTAKALGGNVSFTYFTENGEKLDSYPKTYGSYYVVAECDGGENYLPISSEKFAFKVIKVVPVSIFISLLKNEFSAFDTLSPENFALYYKNNDGSETLVTKDEIKIEYEGGEAFIFGKGGATVSCGGFTTEISVTVKRANYDLSGVFWTDGEFTYDGKEKTAILRGLPSGISVKEYHGNTATQAGVYVATAILAYDAENYNPPVIEPHTFVIKKQSVKLPTFESLTYNGEEQTPIFENPLYKTEFTRGAHAGSYEAKITLYDSDNYELENGAAEAVLYYEILPRKITISLSKAHKYLFSKMPRPSYVVTEGEVASGDDLRLSFTYGKNSVECTSDNPDYEVTVIRGELVRHNFPSRNTLFWIFLIFLSCVTLTLIILVLVLRKKEIVHYFAALKCRLSPVAKATAQTTFKEVAIPLKEEDPEESADVEICEDVEIKIPIDRERADTLISDTLAKELVHREDTVIETEGRKKRIINVDTLSERFSQGERIDVNKLKEANLVPYDTAYIKVLARGVIDKSLTVYANDFSLSAVKMIALSGGEAVKVVTVKKRNKNSEKS